LKPMNWYEIHKTSAHPIKVGNYVVAYSGDEKKRPGEHMAAELMKSDPVKYTKYFFSKNK
jgi:hypothetical protein